jgi:hypothetical protein
VKPPPGDNKEDLQKAIVPLDIACGGKYLFDFEITSLLDKMVKAGLAVTVVLDCCHSGDAGRNHCGGQSSFRGISQIDATENAQIDAIEDGVHRATVIQVPENLSAPAGSYEPNAERGKRVNSWNPQGYELLAACRVNERAYERRYENGQWHGVLTYNLLDSLKTGCANLTHGMLHRRLVAMVHGFSNDQTPFFKGDSQRYIFSRNRLDSQYPSITVKKLDGSYTILDAGSAQGIQVNNEYTIYPWDASDFSDSNRSSRVHVTEVYSLESKAVLMEQPAEDRLIEPGFQAIPYKTLVRELAVRFSKCLNSIEGDMFDQLKKAIDSGNIQDRSARLDPFVKVVSGPEESTAYHVGVDNSKYMLLNTSNKPINHFPSSANPKLFLRNIWHLAKFEFFRGLKNSDVPDYLKNFSFILEAHGTGNNSTRALCLPFSLQLMHHI